MTTSQSTIDFLLDQLTGCGAVTARKMFGEYCLYFDGKPIGLVCDNQLFLKPTAAVRAMMNEPVEGIPYPNARPHLLISADLWEDRDNLCQWVTASHQALAKTPHGKPVATKRSMPKKVQGEPDDLARLANLGPKSRHMLQSVGICTVAQLRQTGSIAAYGAIKQAGLPASLNLLWALEGALTRQSWQVVARDHRTSLLLALEQFQRDHSQ